MNKDYRKIDVEKLTEAVRQFAADWWVEDKKTTHADILKAVLDSLEPDQQKDFYGKSGQVDEEEEKEKRKRNIEMNIALDHSWQESQKEAIDEQKGKIGFGICSQCGAANYQCGCKLEIQPPTEPITEYKKQKGLIPKGQNSIRKPPTECEQCKGFLGVCCNECWRDKVKAKPPTRLEDWKQFEYWINELDEEDLVKSRELIINIIKDKCAKIDEMEGALREIAGSKNVYTDELDEADSQKRIARQTLAKLDGLTFSDGWVRCRKAIATAIKARRITNQDDD